MLKVNTDCEQRYKIVGCNSAEVHKFFELFIGESVAIEAKGAEATTGVYVSFFFLEPMPAYFHVVSLEHIHAFFSRVVCCFICNLKWVHSITIEKLIMVLVP